MVDTHRKRKFEFNSRNNKKVGRKIRIDGIWETKTIYIDGIKLSPQESLEYVNHSPDGFNWSYLGSGPAQLAFAILLELFGQEIASDKYEKFKEKFVSRLPSSNFTTNINIEKWLLDN